MEFVLALFCGVLGFFSWLLWGIVVGLVFFGAAAIPWGIWEGFMALTFNNIINLFAKLPSWLGFIFGFVLSLPFAAISVAAMIWVYIQTVMMGILTFYGCAGDEFCTTFIEKIVVPWEGSWPKGFIIVRYYYEHFQWLWGGSGIFHSWFPWQNGVWLDVGERLPIPFTCIKLFLLALPYLVMFVLPLIPLLWSLMRPFVGGMCALPSVIVPPGRDD